MVHLCMYSVTSSLYICRECMYLSVHVTSEYIPCQTLQIWTWDVYTSRCIYMVYTCICIRKVLHGCIYMYIHAGVYTMYIQLYAWYILRHVYTMYMRVCTFRVLYMSWCTVGVHSTYYSSWHEAMYRVHEGMYTNIPGGKDSRWPGGKDSWCIIMASSQSSWSGDSDHESGPSHDGIGIVTVAPWRPGTPGRYHVIRSYLEY